MFNKLFRNFEIAARWNPGNPRTCYQWANELYQLGKIKRSVNMLIRTLRIKSDYIGAYQLMKLILKQHTNVDANLISLIDKCCALSDQLHVDEDLMKLKLKIIFKLINKLTYKNKVITSKRKKITIN